MPAQVELYLIYGTVDPLLRSNEEVGRKDTIVVQPLHGNPGERIHRFDALDLITPEDDTDDVVVVSQEDIHRVSLHPEVATVVFGCLVTRVEAVDQQTQELIPLDGLPYGDLDGGFVEVLRITDPVEAGDRRDHDHVVPSREQRGGSGQS